MSGKGFPNPGTDPMGALTALLTDGMKLIAQAAKLPEPDAPTCEQTCTTQGCGQLIRVVLDAETVIKLASPEGRVVMCRKCMQEYVLRSTFTARD